MTGDNETWNWNWSEVQKHTCNYQLPREENNEKQQIENLWDNNFNNYYL